MRTFLRSVDARYMALVAAMPILVLAPALVRSSRLIYPSWSDLSDLTLIHWPKMVLIRDALSHGQGIPLWSSYALSGQPLAANQLAMLFYPPALLLWAGPLGLMFSWFYALHLAWAGIGTYWLARGLDRSPRSALLAGAIFALSGKLLAHTAIGHVSLVAAMAWTPWALACLHRALARSSTSFALLVGVSLAAQAATHTYALVYTSYGLVAYAVLYVLLEPGGMRDRLHRSLRHGFRLGLVPVVALSLGAAQLLPLWEMARYSNRAFGFREATTFSLSPIQTATGLLLPAPRVGHEWTIYAALLTWGLAAAAWRARRERAVAILGLLTLTGALLALGSYTPLYRLAYGVLPGLRWIRTPARLWLFCTLGLAILAAYGAEAWEQAWRWPAGRAVRRVLIAWIAFAVVMSLGVAVTLHQGGRGVWGLAVFGSLSGGVLLSALRRRTAPLFTILAVALVVADLASFDVALLRLVPQAQVLDQGLDVATWLANQDGPFRTYSPSYSLPQPAAAQAGLGQIDGVEPVHLADYDRFMARAGGYGQGPFSVTIPPFGEDASVAEAHRETLPDLRLLGLLNGRYLAAAFPADLPGLALRWQGDGTWIYENEHALPRAWVVHQTEVVSHAEAWEGLDTLEPATAALVEAGTPLSGTSAASAAEIIHLASDRMVAEVRLDEPGLLVLSEIWYPGWQATDNGNPVPIVRTDAILRGIPLEAGSHTVEVIYRPWTVRVGVITSLGAVLALLAYVALRRAGQP